MLPGIVLAGLEVCRLHRQHLQQQQLTTANIQQQQQQQDDKPAVPAYHEQLLQLLLPGASQADLEQQQQQQSVQLRPVLYVLQAAATAKHIMQQQQQQQRQSWELAVDAVLLPTLLELALLQPQDCKLVAEALICALNAPQHPMRGSNQAQRKALECLLAHLGPAVLKSSSSSSSVGGGEPDGTELAQTAAWQLLLVLIDPGMRRSQS
jgi:hypothetical protein